MKYLVFFLIFLFSVCANAKQTSPTLYHCPSLGDIKYDKNDGTFSAHTNYNNIAMRWFSMRIFRGSVINVANFTSANNVGDCVGETCEIRCSYSTDNNEFFSLGVSYQEYRFLKSADGPWNGDNCDDLQPETCTYYVVRKHYFSDEL